MTDNFKEGDSDERLEYYLSIGAVTLEGVDEDGEIIYAITEDAEHLAPELWQSHTEYVDRSLVEMYEAGLINVTYNDNLEAIIEMSEEGHEMAKELGLVEINMHEEDIPND